jgi:hypothetical protein
MVPLTMAAVTVTAAGIAALIAAGRGGSAAGGLSGAGGGRSAGRSGLGARRSSGTGRLAAARTASRLATAVIAIEQASLGVVGKQRNGATRQQQSKQNLRFHGSPQNGEQDVYFAATRRIPSNALATNFLLAAIVKPCGWR